VGSGEWAVGGGEWRGAMLGRGWALLPSPGTRTPEPGTRFPPHQRRGPYHRPMFTPPLQLIRPGLFVTATDTEVGKTVIACAVAALLRREGLRVGVCKPLASGCRKDREGLVSEDAEALAHFADCRQPMDVIHPLRYAAPLAPAVAAEQTGEPPDWSLLSRSLERLDAGHDAMVIEGIGGLLVPIEPQQPHVTVLDLIQSLGYPTVVVTRAGLGTLNHTAMTVRLLQDAGCPVAGIVINGYEPDEGDAEARHRADATKPRDESIATNRLWLAQMNRVPILATVPRCPAEQVQVHKGRLPDEVMDAMAMTYWPNVLAKPQCVT